MTSISEVSVGLLALFVALGTVTLAVDRDVRRRTRPGVEPRYLRSRPRFVAALVCGVALGCAGVVALSAWS